MAPAVGPSVPHHELRGVLGVVDPVGWRSGPEEIVGVPVPLDAAERGVVAVETQRHVCVGEDGLLALSRAGGAHVELRPRCGRDHACRQDELEPLRACRERDDIAADGRRHAAAREK